MEPSDEALVLACRSGDAAAWETLIARYQRLVFSIPRRVGLDTDLSAEVFQQVFTILLERLDQEICRIHRTQLGHVDRKLLRRLIDLLTAVRGGQDG